MTRRLGFFSPILSLKFSLLGLLSNSHSSVISFLGSLSRFLSPRSFLSSSLFQVLYLIFTLSGSLSQTLWFCILGSLPRVLSLLSRVFLLGISFTKGFSLLGSICYLAIMKQLYIHFLPYLFLVCLPCILLSRDRQLKIETPYQYW